MSRESNNVKNLLTIVSTILGFIVLYKIFSELKKDVNENTSTDIVSDEGREVLSDSKKRDSLRKAIEHYHKEGNWDLLSKIND